MLLGWVLRYGTHWIYLHMYILTVQILTKHLREYECPGESGPASIPRIPPLLLRHHGRHYGTWFGTYYYAAIPNFHFIVSTNGNINNLILSFKMMLLFGNLIARPHLPCFWPQQWWCCKYILAKIDTHILNSKGTGSNDESYFGGGRGWVCPRAFSHGSRRLGGVDGILLFRLWHERGSVPGSRGTLAVSQGMHLSRIWAWQWWDRRYAHLITVYSRFELSVYNVSR